MARNATALTSWARAIRKTLDAAGCDGDAMLREAGMDPRLLDDPNARYPLEQTTRLWRLAVAATGDSCLGLKVASQVSQTTFHALGYTLIASVTLREAFERVVRYFRIVTDAADLEFRRVGNEYHLLTHVPDNGPQPAYEAVDAFVSLHIRMCRSLLDRRDFAPLRIELRRPAPVDVSGFEAVLRAPLVFGAPANRIVFDRASLDRPLEGANPELARHNDEIVVKYLAQFDRGNVLARLEHALIERLPHGEPSQTDIARSLHMSTRSLQRKLADEGRTYKEILDTTRRDLARSYLSGGRHTVSEVAFLLGFSDTGSFTRAFRRWTGTAPSQWRAQRAAGN